MRLEENFDGFGIPLKEQDSQGEKLDRKVFLYMEPEGEIEDFAQCSSCYLWTGKTCLIHGKMEVAGDATCELYVHGSPQTDKLGQEKELVTPEISGLNKVLVQCRRCVSFDGKDKCHLFEMLNEKLPEKFNVEETVKPMGCCNGFDSKA